MVLWICAPKVIESNVTPAPRSPPGGLTVMSLALEYQSGQAVAWMRCSQIFRGRGDHDVVVGEQVGLLGHDALRPVDVRRAALDVLND